MKTQNMKAPLFSTARLPLPALALACLLIPTMASAQVVVTETFTGTAGTTFLGQTTSDGNAVWSAQQGNAAANAADQYTAVGSTPFTSQFGSSYMNGAANRQNAYSLIYDLDGYTELILNIGQFQAPTPGTTSSVFFRIGARTTTNNGFNAYQFTALSTNSFYVGYVDETGTLTEVGTINTTGAGTSLHNDISLVVTANTQQLYIGGVAFDSIARATQTVAGSGLAQYWSFYQGASANNTFRMDNLTITVVPEPATSALLLGGIAFAILLRRRRMRALQ
ncbi:PEP-CTERM putative exosortase interaction domain-containing protein [Opitutaceae bacterium TAV1]|nr:PEP-CTERM putative exosortase interaction domain-containing protein [Opitutaceae bacterium TAV1]